MQEEEEEEKKKFSTSKLSTQPQKQKQKLFPSFLWHAFWVAIMGRAKPSYSCPAYPRQRLPSDCAESETSKPTLSKPSQRKLGAGQDSVIIIVNVQHRPKATGPQWIAIPA